MRLPDELHWLFWDLDAVELDSERHADTILARVLEHARMAEVRWLLEAYGIDRVHRFFREVGHPDVSRRTTEFWRVVLDAKDESWASPPAWRQSSSAPWID